MFRDTARDVITPPGTPSHRPGRHHTARDTITPPGTLSHHPFRPNQELKFLTVSSPLLFMYECIVFHTIQENFFFVPR